MKAVRIAVVASLVLGMPLVASAQPNNQNGTSSSATQCRDADGQIHMKSATAGKKGDLTTGANVGSSGTKSGGSANNTTRSGGAGAKTSGQASDLALC